MTEYDDPAGNVISYTYDPTTFRLLSVTDALGQVGVRQHLLTEFKGKSLVRVAKRGAEQAVNRGADALFPLPGKGTGGFPRPASFDTARVSETLFRLPNP